MGASISIRAKLRDASGASIVIALVFFLICAIIGSVVLTAASVQAKAAQTHTTAQRAEFAVSSAAETVGADLAAARCAVSKDGDNYTVTTEGDQNSFHAKFWTQYGPDIVKGYQNSLTNGDKSKDLLSASGLEINPGVGSDESNLGGVVYGSIVVDGNLNMVVHLSKSKNLNADSDYNMTVKLQCVPSFELKGELAGFEYEPAIITKTGDA